MKTEKLYGLDVCIEDIEKIVSHVMGSSGKIHIISGNAEVFKYPLKNREKFKQFSDSRNLIITDGISVSLPLGKLYKKSIPRVTGIDLMQRLLVESEKINKTIYFLGSKENVLNDMKLNISAAYPNLNIVGAHHGYIDVDNCEEVIKDIIKCKPNMLFVAMGTPTQEEFIFKYIDNLPCMLYMGVGGSFDVLSGHVKRCPKWVSKIGMEWMYRIFKDPSKINRVYNNLFFTIKTLLKGKKCYINN